MRTVPFGGVLAHGVLAVQKSFLIPSQRPFNCFSYYVRLTGESIRYILYIGNYRINCILNGGVLVLNKRNFFLAILLGFLLLLLPQISQASIKVIAGDHPVFVSSHVMGNQIIQYQNGNRSLDGLIMGFTAAGFPAKTVFSTSTNFIATGKFGSVSNAMVLTDAAGKANLCRYEFDLNFPRAGAMQNQIVQWKVSFPNEGFYAINIFVDGALVGYYPFYVWAK